jgi:hypothetical protein
MACNSGIRARNAGASWLVFVDANANEGGFSILKYGMKDVYGSRDTEWWNTYHEFPLRPIQAP